METASATDMRGGERRPMMSSVPAHPSLAYTDVVSNAEHRLFNTEILFYS